MTTAFIFPGQGSQSVGMGKALFENFGASRAVFEESDEALSEKLSTLIFDGPDAELTLTRNAQPALMTVSMAALKALESERGVDLRRDIAFVAGHSLGEYSALCAARALTLADTARLVRIRGQAMQAGFVLRAQEALRGGDTHGEQLATLFFSELQVPVLFQQHQQSGQGQQEPFGTHIVCRLPGQKEGLLHRWTVLGQTAALNGLLDVLSMVEQLDGIFAGIARPFDE